MTIRWVFLCLFFSGCMATDTFHLADLQSKNQTLSITRQKQRIAFLQKKLDNAEKGLHKAQNEVESLQTDLHQSQLSLIAQQIAKSEKEPRYRKQKEGEDRNSLFLIERELLQQMMESGPSPEAFEAQVVLDRILRMITEFRDEER